MVYSTTRQLDKLGSEHCSMPAEMHDFRFEYLTHKVMADINSSGRNGSIFKSWKHAISETLSQMTSDLYGQDVPSSAAYSRQQAFALNLQQLSITAKVSIFARTKHINLLATPGYRRLEPKLGGTRMHITSCRRYPCMM